jgi:hypothetical protein
MTPEQMKEYEAIIEDCPRTLGKYRIKSHPDRNHFSAKKGSIFFRGNLYLEYHFLQTHLLKHSGKFNVLSHLVDTLKQSTNEKMVIVSGSTKM